MLQVLQVPTLFVNDSWAYLNIICYSELDLVTQSNYCHQSYAHKTLLQHHFRDCRNRVILIQYREKVYNNFPKMLSLFNI